MLRQLFISLIAIIGVVGSALGQTSVELGVPRNATVGNRFTISITVNNPSGNVTGLKVPELDGCSFIGGPGTSSSSSVSIINGRMERSETRSYTYTYRADKAGTVKVAPVTISVDGKSYTAACKQFTIQEGNAQPSQSGSGNGGRQQAGRSSDFQIGANDLFLTVSTNASSVYEQQAVECMIKLYSSNMQVDGLSIQNIPSFDNCIVEVIGTPQTLEWKDEVVNGRTMYSATVYRALLYPQKAGTITLSGGEYLVSAYRQVFVQDFFGYRPVTENKELKMKPRSTSITVKALPEPKPANFSGAVGRFTASARLIGDSFKTNEASSLVYTIEGTGNIKFLPEPKIDFPSEFEVYDPSIDNNAKVSGHNMTGTETIDYTFVPQSVGKFRIGDQEFVYFDPSSAEYKTIHIAGFDVDVKQGANVSSTTISGKQDLQAKNSDIHHIKPGADTPSKLSKPMILKWGYWWTYVCFAAALIVLFISYKKVINTDEANRRLNRAGKVARKRLSTAGKLLKSRKYDEFYAEMLSAMQSYLSDKLQIPASQLNRDNILASLSTRGADEQSQQDLVEILNDCEMARYTPQSSAEAADKTYEKARKLIDRIENLK